MPASSSATYGLLHEGLSLPNRIRIVVVVLFDSPNCFYVYISGQSVIILWQFNGCTFISCVHPSRRQYNYVSRVIPTSSETRLLSFGTIWRGKHALSTTDARLLCYDHGAWPIHRGLPSVIGVCIGMRAILYPMTALFAQYARCHRDCGQM